MEEKKVIIEEAEHVVLDGNITDDANEGGNFSEEVCESKEEVVDEEIKDKGDVDIESEYPEVIRKEKLIPESEMKSELDDLKAKYADLLSRFDALIDGGSTVVDNTETVDEEDEDETEKSLDELDFKVDKFM